MTTPVPPLHQIEIIIRNFAGETLISQVYPVTEEASHTFLDRVELMLLTFPHQAFNPIP
jgi:hypothetical protein